MILELVKKHWPGGIPLLISGVIGFIAGQFVPEYLQYAETKRQEVVQVVQLVSQKGDELEQTIRPLMLIAGDQVPPTSEPRTALENKILEVFQTLEAADKKLPGTQAERQAYVAAMMELKSAAGAIEGSLTGRELIEAASEFKMARTRYELKLSELEPTFVGAIFRYFLST